jgi:transcriptional regulator with XRE-family HTH domain
MERISSPGELLREVRVQARMSQRELALQAGTAQSVVARIESGRNSPTLETFRRLLAAAGFDFRAEARRRLRVSARTMEEVERILALTPEARLQEVANLTRFLAAARHA